MANPALNERFLDKIYSHSDTSKMTISGTINKAGLLILIAFLGASMGWGLHSPILLMASMAVGLITAFLVIFNPARATYLSQVYALSEGFMLGSISSVFAAAYPGIVFNALALTLSCLLIMLCLYKFQIVQVTDRFRSILFSATLAIGVTYLIDFAMSFFGSSIPMIHEGTAMGIGFSLIIVGVAAFNLLLDFDMIERAESQGAPKFMEWYGGFALLVTLVWLYMEILRLLSKLNKR